MIPLPAIFSSICETTWQKILTFGRNLPSKQYLWPALQKAILEDKKFELVTVLKNESYRAFLVSFLIPSQPDSACLQCWFQVREILDSLEQYKYPSFNTQVRSNINEKRDNINSIIENGGSLPSGKNGK
jgi:hypothetical protein